MSHLADLQAFYSILAELGRKTGEARPLRSEGGRRRWPRRGVYYFFEPHETRTTSGTEPRVVRVGTHALKLGGSTTLSGRLNQHRGAIRTGGGNHRGSIFRLLVGLALSQRDASIAVATWGDKKIERKIAAPREVQLEREVSQYIGAMPVLALEVPDEPGPDSLRGYIERNSIALLSGFNSGEVDKPSNHWLGHHCPRDRVRRSGLWNNNHVDETYDSQFVGIMEQLMLQQASFEKA